MIAIGSEPDEALAWTERALARDPSLADAEPERLARLRELGSG